VAVIDRGPGIPESFRSRIFQKFSQADSSDTRGKGGTGLGLNISQALIERMGGEIGFVSEPDQGSEFYFELPCRVTSPAPEGTGAPILICEDDPDIARLLSMMLEEGGWNSDIAHDATSARQMLQSGHYLAMTLDLTLPGEDGLSLLHWMRQQHAYADIAVVVVSATADRSKVSLSGGAVGVVDWLSKPIDARRLLAAIDGVFAGRGEGANCILHVDDDREFVEVITQLLGPDIKLVGAANLQQAREKLTQQHFQLILLDLNLPDGNGAELLGNLPPLNQFTPVMIFSAQDVDGHLLEKVSGNLVKSRVSENQLSAILQDFINRCNHGKTIGK
jgi:DNA-binding response OmpR family regulator